MPKQSPKAKKVLSQLPNNVEHRVGVTSCPHCDHNDNDYDSWHAGALAIVTEIVHGKHGSMAVISECPKCFKKSWVHEAFSAFSYTDAYAEWKELAAKTEAERHRKGLIVFCDSLCVRCVHLRGFEGDTLCWKKCTMGKDDAIKLPPGHTFYYQMGNPVTECDKFEERKI